MLRSLFFVFLSLTFLIAGCAPANGKKEMPKNYFDLPEYFTGRIKQLETQNTAIKKKIVKGGKTEAKIIKNIDWEKELTPFVNVDINKPSWIKSFSADTVSLSTDSFEVTYTALDNEIPIKQVKLLFENNSCSFVQINKRSDNKLFSSFQKLEYRDGKGYKINGYQKVKYAFDTEYEIVSELIIN